MPSPEPRPLLLNAFEMAVPVHQSPGLWRHPEDRSRDYTSLAHWTRLARTLEDGGFHGIFFADVLGQYDVHGGSGDAAARGGVQFPMLDPLLLVPALAAVTERIGFGVTASVGYEHPYALARRLSTLDHLTGGRVAWNIVTSYQDSAARNLGRDRQVPHDERYDRAEEYLDVVYRLWESSFDDDAVVADPAAGVYVDPSRVRGIGHEGERFSVPGPALVEPSPQRTPLLFQAGASARGRAFAAKHAEAVFLSGPTAEQTAGWVRAVRAEAAGRGRDPRRVKAFSNVNVVVADTDAEALARLEDYRRHVDVEAALALFAGWTGVDLSGADPDAPLAYVTTDGNRSALASFTTLDPDRVWTPRLLAEFVSIGGRGPVLAGSPATVADGLERWARVADVDGFNVNAAVRPGDFERFARLVSPELRRRGLLEEPVPGATLRETVLGEGPRLAPDHYGAGFRPVPAAR